MGSVCLAASALPATFLALDFNDPRDIGSFIGIQFEHGRIRGEAIFIRECILPPRCLEAVAVLIEDRVPNGPERVAGERIQRLPGDVVIIGASDA
jgi:hypothetical protein